MIGASAAQSSTLQVFDAFLGVEHTEEKKEFLLQMRSFMPPGHRQLIVDLEQSSCKLLDFVRNSGDRSLELAYNNCLSAVADFRSYHIQVVKKYIIVPLRQLNKDVETLDIKGTGGTSLIPFLKMLLLDTQRRMVSPFKKVTGSSDMEKGHGRWTQAGYVLVLAGAVVVSLALISGRSVMKS